MSAGIKFIICPDFSVVIENLSKSTTFNISSRRGVISTMPVTKIGSCFGTYSLSSLLVSVSWWLRMSNLLCTGTLYFPVLICC